MTKYFLLPILFTVLSTCTTDDPPAVEVSTPPVIDTIPTATDNVGTLQGSWRSVEDDKSVLRFEGNSMIMSYDGSDEESGENFIVGPECPGSPPAGTGDPTGRYISVPDADLCYYIIKLTETELELSFVGRGNTLRYRREG
ncbi:hypothetical protein [Lewinella sp. JB7]|uniref:hypothetical protein n=1 Tax=Lewinella sp. JB7 TaxID=2962887 RepID=UPI0020C9C4A7|nr:hypothetical protein [Lewinella sp. JB7]MCP9237692.1 hypothetical protein [Lewinella sp. JB7]